MTADLWLNGAAFLAGCGAVEIALVSGLRRHLSDTRRHIGYAAHFLLDPAISDHWKERASKLYASRLTMATYQVTLSLFLAMIPFASVLRLASGSWALALEMASSPGMFAPPMAGSVVWWMARFRDPSR